ncbi:hypothetical protein BGZ61DRAFT_453592 [Ilyonectria robusta]|uniref:uncharacterized protein n=1 Tax=Ilyonectria robusta TaxID=1079257 RepID=UPI001E8DA7CE|nr:uncharacterized protein BGZ61DRAFT_453592 [Ilyonectria robusta]KAH8686760.1 hypothetical protein BGZ61DRAFT_453592 [Ilyonectria robusta]
MLEARALLFSSLLFSLSIHHRQTGPEVDLSPTLLWVLHVCRLYWLPSSCCTRGSSSKPSTYHLSTVHVSCVVLAGLLHVPNACGCS